MLLWKQLPQKTSYLDPVIQSGKKRAHLGPQAYATHANWSDDMSNSIRQGHVQKGVFRPRDRPLVTQEFMKDAKLKAIPAPGVYDMPKPAKSLLGHSDKSDRSSYHIDVAIH